MKLDNDQPAAERPPVRMVTFRVINPFYRGKYGKLYNRDELITVPEPGSPEFIEEFGSPFKSRAWIGLDELAPGEQPVDPDTEPTPEPRTLSELQHSTGRRRRRPPGA